MTLASELPGGHPAAYPADYRIRILGNLDPTWSCMLGGLALSTQRTEDDRWTTTLEGRIVDQATLMTVLNLLDDLGALLLSIERIAAAKR